MTETVTISAAEELAERLRVAPLIEWSRFVPQTAMPQEYGASTVTVLPTRGQAEGLGLARVELAAQPPNGDAPCTAAGCGGSRWSGCNAVVRSP